MAKIKKETLSEEEKMIINKYDEKMASLKKKKEEELRKFSERAMKQQLKKSERIMSVLEEVCGELTEEKVELFIGYVKEQAISIRMNVCPGGVPDENTYHNYEYEEGQISEDIL